MGEYAPRLPAVLGSAAALVAAGVGFVARASPLGCLLRSVAAFALFAAFGIVIRYVLESAAVPEVDGEQETSEHQAAGATVEEWMAAAGDAPSGVEDR